MDQALVKTYVLGIEKVFERFGKSTVTSYVEAVREGRKHLEALKAEVVEDVWKTGKGELEPISTMSNERILECLRWVDFFSRDGRDASYQAEGTTEVLLTTLLNRMSNYETS